jgi:hypothetical protein
MIISMRESESEDLLELERTLDHMIRTVEPGGKRRIELTLDLDMDGARMLHEALRLARLNGQRVQ